jgi:hypothetical protein
VGRNLSEDSGIQFYNLENKYTPAVSHTSGVAVVLDHTNGISRFSVSCHPTA